MMCCFSFFISPSFSYFCLFLPEKLYPSKVGSGSQIILLFDRWYLLRMKNGVEVANNHCIYMFLFGNEYSLHFYLPAESLHICHSSH
jgi:hypothetical protein